MVTLLMEVARTEDRKKVSGKDILLTLKKRKGHVARLRSDHQAIKAVKERETPILL
jgi:hypothetical protein